MDGDEYFVSWDERLIPEKLEKPFPCPDKTIGANIKDEITVQDLIREFTASEHLVGRINNLFIDWAKLAGASSSECRQLAKLFNQSVDTAKHGGKVEISKHLTVNYDNLFLIYLLLVGSRQRGRRTTAPWKNDRANEKAAFQGNCGYDDKIQRTKQHAHANRSESYILFYKR